MRGFYLLCKDFISKNLSFSISNKIVITSFKLEDMSLEN